MALRKIGLLGGSFDPVHLAHVALGKAAWEHLSLAELQFIPAGQPWQRRPLSATSAQRVDMLHIALRDYPYMTVNPIELERDGETYTVDTLEQLPPGPDYYWVLGADQLENFCTWHRWQDIASRVRLAVAQRPGTPLAAPAALASHLASLGLELVELPFEPVAISSTAIRERLARGASTAGLLDVAVAQYIHRNGLYQAPVA
jgi:nicotinate-nucleotide adenylyltransferase